MPPKTYRFELRMDEDLMTRVDAWRQDAGLDVSRSEAFRQLVEMGLSGATGGDKLKPPLSVGERLILGYLSEIHDTLPANKKRMRDNLVMEAIGGGHYWAFGWELPGLIHDMVDSEETVGEVADILEMWSTIEESFNELDGDDQAKVQAVIGGKPVKFPGFDGNNESRHLSIARFLIHEMKRFAEFKDHDLNSHRRSIERYRMMRAHYSELEPNLLGRYLTAEEIVSLVKPGR